MQSIDVLNKLLDYRFQYEEMARELGKLKDKKFIVKGELIDHKDEQVEITVCDVNLSKSQVEFSFYDEPIEGEEENSLWWNHMSISKFAYGIISEV